MNKQNAPISCKFTELVQPYLSEQETSVFIQIVDYLFNDLAEGHSCSDLKQLAANLKLSVAEICQILDKSTLVAVYSSINKKLTALPFSLWQTTERDLLYITRYLAYEVRIAHKVKHLLAYKYPDNLNQLITTTLSRLHQKNGLPNREQINAIENSCCNKFSIITGGPGTGKTTTVVLLLWALYNCYGSELNIQICAPTGKAAIRVRDSILANIARLKNEAADLINISCLDSLIANSNNFSTIHKLLGAIPNDIYFRHNRDKPLECEILIIDESSMIGLPLFSKLLDALDEHKLKHIVFLGDKNQLSSVEEGYVFSSLVDLRITEDNQAADDLFNQFVETSLAKELIETKRSNQDILNFAGAVLNNQPDAAINYLSHANSLVWHEPRLANYVQCVMQDNSALLQFIEYTQQITFSNLDAKELFAKFTQQSTLCLANSGALGCENINHQLERQIKLKLAFADEWYSGRPIIVLQNDYTLELFNGDIGICVVDNSEVRIVFENGKQLIPELLPRHALAYAITIHKSQGSEYDLVNVLIPNVSNDSNLAQLLSRSLLYTGVTRAKHNVNVFASVDSLQFAIGNNNLRISGLSHMMNV